MTFCSETAQRPLAPESYEIHLAYDLERLATLCGRILRRLRPLVPARARRVG
jgi:hypothetical protein